MCLVSDPSQPNDEDMILNAAGKTRTACLYATSRPKLTVYRCFLMIGPLPEASSESTSGDNVVDYAVLKQDWFVVSRALTTDADTT